ncbi:hypothetical protein LRS10_09865 [Phenylobacterium sp. J426]|uniref:hypothetical protein n=1 Tax=Phenylobacterium sp. J426 TaxID=2898439 RepID=UPI002150E03D|nr:hypothetical protein [Phenylobacterium sp. J426]MCR5874447.1 hypothetical protein [Phenylobacterium sp. J426]
MNDIQATPVLGPDPALPRAVSGDLEEIFRSAPRIEPGRTGGRVRSIAAARDGARERRPARMGALAATALVGLALGAVIARPGKVAPEAQAEAPRPQQVARIDVPPVTPPPVSAIRPEAATPAAQALPAPTPSATPRAPTVERVKATQTERRDPPRTKAKASSGGGYHCNGMTRSAEARCAYPAVLAADRNLRAAYDRAVRAGVPRQELVSYRSRWASLRHRADDQPAKVIYGYRAMARDLDRLSGART